MNEDLVDDFLLPPVEAFYDDFFTEKLNTDRIHALFEACTFVDAMHLPSSDTPSLANFITIALFSRNYLPIGQ